MTAHPTFLIDILCIQVTLLKLSFWSLKIETYLYFARQQENVQILGIPTQWVSVGEARSAISDFPACLQLQHCEQTYGTL